MWKLRITISGGPATNVVKTHRTSLIVDPPTAKILLSYRKRGTDKGSRLSYRPLRATGGFEPAGARTRGSTAACGACLSRVSRDFQCRVQTQYPDVQGPIA